MQYVCGVYVLWMSTLMMLLLQSGFLNLAPWILPLLNVIIMRLWITQGPG